MNIEMKLNWKNRGEFNQRISLNSSLTRTKSPFLLKIPTSFLLSTVMHGLGFSSTYKTIIWPGFPFEPPLRFQKDILRVVGVFDGINDAPLGRSLCALFPDCLRTLLPTCNLALLSTGHISRCYSILQVSQSI